MINNLKIIFSKNKFILLIIQFFLRAKSKYGYNKNNYFFDNINKVDNCSFITFFL